MVTPWTSDTRGECRCGRQPGSHSTPSSGVLTGFDCFVLKKLFFFAPGQADDSPGRATKFLSLLHRVLGFAAFFVARSRVQLTCSSCLSQHSDFGQEDVKTRLAAISSQFTPLTPEFLTGFYCFPYKKLFLDERTDTEPRH